MAYYGKIRSPETKTEVKQAANILFVLGILFGLGALLGAGAWFSNRNRDWLILAGVLGFITPLLLSAGAYNIYYTRRMQHHPLMTKALGNPMITVFGILFFLFVVIFGGIALLIYSK
ncbi:MAG TPA: hypothetical protein PKY82_16920 [Pyrinomonadaceae bacterium]|nr:hypothetical protein [Pyrinomonadaceae bacterium]